MTGDLINLITQVAQLSGAPKPAWLDDEAPVLADDAAGQGDEGFYLIGLIGGKEVGKSALVNALVGRGITQQTSFGPGTEIAVAYAHSGQAQALTELLEREAAGKYRIVTHEMPELRRQVLLDLPDIDSHFAEHIALTRRMLRHMLFPIWAQSVEKYADLQPQELLKRVASGNAPANFIFCLNKVDQVKNAAEITALQEDYASRLAKMLGLPAPPRVWAISALRPTEYEMPVLRQLLSQQKSAVDVRGSRDLASSRQRASALAWLEEQNVPQRAGRLSRLQEDAEEIISQRIGAPLLEILLPRLQEDPAHRRAILEDCLSRRIARWPIINVLHPLYWAIGAFVHRNTESRPAVAASLSGEVLVDIHLAELAGAELTIDANPPATAQKGGTVAAAAPATQNRTLATMLQNAFALIQQSHPAISGIYRGTKPWESSPAAMATDDLRRKLSATIDRQRRQACGNIDSGAGPLGVLLRGILTIGALLWFPFFQPVAEQWHDPHGITPVLIHALSMQNLLGSVLFFALYFTVIWVILRWDTQRRLDARAARWKQTQAADPALNLTSQILDWLNGLLTPIRNEHARVDSLVTQINHLREVVAQAAVK